MLVCAALLGAPSALLAQSGTADVAISKTGDVAADAGDTLVFQLQATNLGPGVARSVVVQDQLPPELLFLAASDGATHNAGVVTWPPIDSLGAAASSPVFTLTVLALNPTPDRRVVNNRGQVSTATTDPDPSNDVVDVPVVVEGQLQIPPDVQVTLFAPDSVFSGDVFQYVIEVVNTGPGTEEDVRVTHRLPAAVTLLGTTPGAVQNGNTLSWPQIDSIVAGERRTFVIDVRAPNGPDTLTATSNATGALGDRSPGDNTATAVTRVVQRVRPVANLTISKAGPPTVASEGIARYTIVVRNTGSVTATDVVVRDVLPPNGAFRVASGSGQASGGVVTWDTIPSLAPSTSRTFTVDVAAPQGPAVMVNRATVSSATPESTLQDNTSQAITEVVAPMTADVSVMKTGPAVAQIGDTVQYRIEVDNAGPAIATNVTVTDSLPVGARLIDADGGQVTGSVVVWNLATLNANAGRAFMLTVAFDSAGSYTNLAGVTAGEPDPDPSNNADSVTTLVNEGADMEVRVAIRAGGQIVDSLLVGDSIEFEVRVENLGPDTALNVVVDLDTPDTRTDGGGGARSPIREVLGTIAPGATWDSVYVVRYNTVGTYVGTGRVTATTYDPRLSNNFSTATVVVDSTRPPPPPPPPPPTSLAVVVDKQVSDSDAEVGDVVRYTVLARVIGTGGPTPLELVDRPPPGFTYVAGSTVIDGVPSADPTPTADGGWVLPLGARSASDSIVISYRSRVGPDAANSDGVNRARVRGPGIVSNEAQARVRVRNLPDRGIILGTVFTDCGCSDPGIKAPGEVGIPGVRIYLQDGSWTYTDSEGKYSFVDLSPRSWVVAVDVSTLPAGARLVPVTTRHAGEGRSVWVDLKRGELARADFVDGSGLQIVKDSAVARSQATHPNRAVASGRTPRVGANIPNPFSGLRSPAPVVDWEALLRRAQMRDVESAVEDSTRLATLNDSTALLAGDSLPDADFMALGLVEARLDLRSLSLSELGSVRTRDRFEDALRTWSVDSDSEQTVVGTRAALFADGSVGDNGWLTLRLDSEHDRRAELFRDIQPDEQYSVLGDASPQNFDAQSKGRLFGRYSRGASFAQWGDFNTSGSTRGIAETRSLGAYARTLNGWLQHFENERVQVEAFASRDRFSQVIDELPSRGVSGPYALSRRDGLINSETVDLVTRDRTQPGVIIRTERMQRFADYTIEPFTGRLLFRRPVPTTDDNFNPVSVRVSYEVEAGGEAFWTYGADGQFLLFDSRGGAGQSGAAGVALEVGGGFVRDENPAVAFDLGTVNATLALGESTRVTSEFARTDSSSTRSGGAARVELTHRSGPIDARAFWLRTDSLFANPSSSYQPSREEMGFLGSARLTDASLLLGELLRTEERRTGDRRSGGRIAFDRALTDVIRAQLGFRFSRYDGTQSSDSSDVDALAVRLTAEPGEKSRVFAEFEQDVTEGDRRRAALGGDYRIFGGNRLYGRYEFLDELEGPYRAATGQSRNGTLFGIASDYRDGQSVFTEYRSRDAFGGREAHAAIGLRNRWRIREGVEVNGSAERLTPFDEGTPATALTGALALTYDPAWKATARAEYYARDGVDNLLGSLGYARKLSREFTLLGRSAFSVELGGGRAFERTQLGVAYRDVDHNRWNVLSRYEHRYDRELLNGETSTTSAHLLSTHINVLPAAGTLVRGQWVTRLGDETSEIDEFDFGGDSHLFGVRTTFDLARYLDIGVVGRRLLAGAAAADQYGLGFEVGTVLTNDLRLAAGYNAFGFSDDNNLTNDATDHGFYLQLGFKFDESLFGARRTEAARTDSTAQCDCLMPPDTPPVVRPDSADLRLNGSQTRVTERGDSVDVTMQWSVSNAGPDAATSPELTVDLPDGARWVEGGTPTGRRVDWTELSNLSPGEDTDVTLVVRVERCGWEGGAIGRVRANTIDPNAGNNDATLRLRVDADCTPDVSVRIDAPDTVTAGEEIEWVVTRTVAAGQDDARRVEQSASSTGGDLVELPGLDYQSTGAGDVMASWPTIDLVSAGDVTVDTLRTQTTVCYGDGQSVDLAAAVQAQVDGNPDNDAASVTVAVRCRPVAELALSITGPDRRPAYIDSVLVFELHTENTGDSTAYDVRVRAHLDGRYSFVDGWRGSGDSLVQAAGLRGVVDWPVHDSLPVGSTIVDTLRVKGSGARKVFDIVDSVAFASGAGTQTVATSIGTLLIRPDSLDIRGDTTDIAVEIRGPAWAAPGDTVTFDIVATNVSPDTARGVKLSVGRPAGIKYVKSWLLPADPEGAGAGGSGGSGGRGGGGGGSIPIQQATDSVFGSDNRYRRVSWPHVAQLLPGGELRGAVVLVAPPVVGLYRVELTGTVSNIELELDNNSSSDSVWTDFGRPDLRLNLRWLEKTDSSALFNVQVVNVGQGTARPVTVVVNLPAGSAFDHDPEADSIAWTVETLAPDAPALDSTFWISFTNAAHLDSVRARAETGPPEVNMDDNQGLVPVIFESASWPWWLLLAALLVGLLCGYLVRRVSESGPSTGGGRKFVPVPIPIPVTPKQHRKRAFDLNREGKRDEAEKIIRELVVREGWNSWNAGHLGRIFKDRFEDVWREAPDGEEAQALLAEAIETYRRGHAPGDPNPYPGLNALTLSEFLSEAPDWKELLIEEVRKALQGAIESQLEKAVEKAMDKAVTGLAEVGQVRDYWTCASVAEFGVLVGDREQAESGLEDALVSPHVIPQAETTLRNLVLIRDAREAKGQTVPMWIVAILARMEEHCRSGSDVKS